VLGAEFLFRNGQRLFGNLRCLEVHTHLVELLHMQQCSEEMEEPEIDRLLPVTRDPNFLK
jgi:hypothetical protein